MDKEKVIKGLEICSEHGSWHGLDCELNEAYKDCPYRGCETGCIVTIAKDAIAMIKEQEAVEPRVSTVEQRCGNCNKVIEMDGWKACPWCGKMIDWKRWWDKNGTHDNT